MNIVSYSNWQENDTCLHEILPKLHKTMELDRKINDNRYQDKIVDEFAKKKQISCSHCTSHVSKLEMIYLANILHNIGQQTIELVLFLLHTVIMYFKAFCREELT